VSTVTYTVGSGGAPNFPGDNSLLTIGATTLTANGGQPGGQTGSTPGTTNGLGGAGGAASLATPSAIIDSIYSIAGQDGTDGQNSVIGNGISFFVFSGSGGSAPEGELVVRDLM
jgi:hypothetical protein